MPLGSSDIDLAQLIELANQRIAAVQASGAEASDFQFDSAINYIRQFCVLYPIQMQNYVKTRTFENLAQAYVNFLNICIALKIVDDTIIPIWKSKTSPEMISNFEAIYTHVKDMDCLAKDLIRDFLEKYYVEEDEADTASLEQHVVISVASPQEGTRPAMGQ